MLNKKKSSLSKRYQASYESKDSGGSRSGVMDWRKVDGEVNFFKPAEGKNRINIIPYTIKTKNHPLVKRGELDIGDLDYVMDIFVHKNIGPSEASVLCLKNTYGKPCPICELQAKLKKEGKEKEANELKASRRVFYNIEDLKESGKLKVFETSHFLFEKELIDESRDDEEGGFIDFADVDDGKEIKFRASEVQKGSMKYKEFKSFSFEARDEKLSEDLVESAVSFDEIISIPTYEESEKILYGVDENDEQEEKTSKKSKFEDDDDEDETPKKSKSEYKEQEEKTSKKSESVDEVEEKKHIHKDKDEDDEHKDDEHEESKTCDKKCGNCPFGHEFGKDTDDFDDCDNCDIWDKCYNGNRK